MNPDHEPWITRDYGGEGKGLNLSKTRLGEFVYELLKFKGAITSTYVMAPDVDRSYVQFSITLPKGQKEAFEAKTGFALEPPTNLVPASNF